MKNKKKLWWLALPVVIIIALVYANYEPVFFNRNCITVNKETGVSSTKWMRSLDSGLHLSEVNLPGVHDAATNHVQLSFFSKCQYFNTYSMLNAGFRYLDIRLGIEKERKDTGAQDMKLMHGFTSCKTSVLPWSDNLYFESVLKECYKFLDENPSETIVMCVKQEHGKDSTVEFQKALFNYVNKNPSYWYLKNRDAYLSEVRGKIVLAHRYSNRYYKDEEAGLDLIWLDQPGSEVKEDIYENNSNFNSHQLYVQDHYEYSKKDKWNAIKNGLPEVNDLSGIVLTFLSTKGTLPYGHPLFYAQTINRRFMKLDLTSGQKYGWLIFDFGNSQLARKVYETNF